MLKAKIMGDPIKKEFDGGITVTVEPANRITVMRLMSKNSDDETAKIDNVGLGSDLAAVCVTDIEGVEPYYTIFKGKRVVSEETYDQIEFSTLAMIYNWIVNLHFVEESERGNL